MIAVGVNSWGWIGHQVSSPSTTPGVSVTPAVGSKGSWVQCFSSGNVPYDVYAMQVWISNAVTSGAARDIVVDIGVDPAGGSSYSTVIADILASQAGNAVNGGRFFYFPLFIKSGSSIAARSQSNVTTAFRVSLILYGRPSNPAMVRTGQYSQTLGASPPVGTSFTPGNSGSEGSYVSLGTLTRSCWFFQLGVGISNATTTSLMYFIDLVAGDGTSYHPIIENFPLFLPGTAEITTSPLRIMDGFWEAPAGSNLYVRGTCSGTAVTGFSADVICIGG